jgi:phosphate:Na+ symporter
MTPDPGTPELAIAPLVMGLLGGLAIFLFGMEQMTAALKAAAGGGMRTLLAGLTRNRFLALFTGAFVTAVIQSSSVTTVLVVGFISAGLMSLSQSVGVILGANVGTTVTAQIIAFKITKYALVLIAAGFAGNFLGRTERVRHVGAMLLGLGFVFFGMGLMSDATSPLRSYEPFIDAMSSMGRPIFGILASAAFTALVQSSSATTGIVIVLASQGFITLEAGIALALGANVGTCVTAGLAALGKPRPAVQAAAVHVFFNVVGVLVWVPFIPELADFIRNISPTAQALSGVDRLAAEVPRQVANAHTTFNLANAVIMIGFTRAIASLVRWVLPDLPSAADRAKPIYLDEVILDTPALAIDRLRMEIGHLGELARGLVIAARDQRAVGLVQPELKESAAELHALYVAIVEYARRLLERHTGEVGATDVEQILKVANHLHNIGDTISINARSISKQLQERGLGASDATRAMMGDLLTRLEEVVAQSVWAFVTRDVELATQVVDLKREIYQRARDVERHLGHRMVGGDADQLVKYRLEIEVVELLKRIYYFSKRIAKTIAEDVEEPEIEAEDEIAA